MTIPFYATKFKIKGAVMPAKVNAITAELDKAIQLQTYTLAQLNGGVASMAANKNLNRLVVCSNGNAGARTLAISDGTNWKVVAIGASIS